MPTRTRLMETAVMLMKERGYDKVSINELCKHLNITRSAFYYHFKTKDEVLDSYIMFPPQFVQNNALLEELAEKSSCREIYYKMIHFFIDRAAYLGPELFCIILNRGMEGNTQLISPRDVPTWKYNVAIIRLAQKRGEITRAEDPEVLAEMSGHLTNGIGMTWCNKHGNFDYYLEIVRMTDLLLGWTD